MPAVVSSMAIEGSTVYRRSGDVVSRHVGREAILVPVHKSVKGLDFIYTLSPVASQVWTLLDGTRSVDEIAEAVSQEFEVDRDRAAQDIVELIDDLGGVSLVTRVS